MYRSLSIAAAFFLVACNDGSTPSGACSANDDCAAGEVCFADACETLCAVDRDCGTGNDCTTGQICTAGVCLAGCRANVPAIDSIDGDGSPDGGSDTRGVKAAHHTQTQLLIGGSNLDGALPMLTPLGGTGIELTVVNSSPTELAANLPQNLTAGEYTLTVSNGAGSDQAGVWVLQGEQGPAGEPQTGAGVLSLLQSLGDPIPGLNAATASSASTATSATNAAAAAALTDAGGTNHPYEEVAVPAGAVMYFATPACPAGWVLADGSIAARASYPALYAAVGDTFGAGDGTTTFGMPDFRGEFLRGLDAGRGVDGSRALGSAQGQDFKSFQVQNSGGPISSPSYTHGPITVPKSGWSTQNLFGGGWSAPTGALKFNFDGSEVRPRNVALRACIKL